MSCSVAFWPWRAAATEDFELEYADQSRRDRMLWFTLRSKLRSREAPSEFELCGVPEEDTLLDEVRSKRERPSAPLVEMTGKSAERDNPRPPSAIRTRAAASRTV